MPKSERSQGNDPACFSSTEVALSETQLPKISSSTSENLPPKLPCTCAGIFTNFGLWIHASKCEKVVAETHGKIRTMASLIKNNKQLRRVLYDARPDLRHAVYLELVPHLSFEPLPFKSLVRSYLHV